MVMQGKLSGWNDTIIALATPPGIGAIGVIRLSGKNAIQIADALFVSKNLSTQSSHTIHGGQLAHDGNPLDEVVVSIFRNPRSYTGEDVIEISAHGSPFIHKQIIQACLQKGARLAQPGEFTQRAFLNGKLDLTQAEAVADLIASNTAASHKSALHNIRGGFSGLLKHLREQLIKFSALIELELDFSQEDVEFADRDQFFNLVTEAKKIIGGLIQSFQLGNVIKNGVQVAIIGKPNAGKSTLLNAFLKENRAIVSEIAGTTRDTIEETLNIDGILFRMIDTAGIREHTGDVIEGMGMEKSYEKMQAADIVIYLFDINETTRNELHEAQTFLEKNGRKFLLVGNKCDDDTESTLAKNKFQNVAEIVFISAKMDRHIEALKERLVDMVLEGKVQTEDTVITNARHYHMLLQMNESLDDIEKGLKENLPGDLLALDIRRCLHFLGEITGEITTEDQLDYIFSKFCIGK
jgi:tRNA modification GTPase